MKSILMTTAVAALMLSVPMSFAADDNKDHGQKSSHETSQPDHANGQSAKDNSGPTPNGSHRSNQSGVFGNGSKMTSTPHPTRTLHKTRSHVSTGTTLNNAPKSNTVQGQNTSQGTHAKIDLHTYQGNITSQHHFHAGDYHAPQGYAYRHWSYGDRLPSIYFGHDFWIGDFGMYDLMAPPDGYVWVRFGPDALLIDEYTGDIVRVEYGVFY